MWITRLIVWLIGVGFVLQVTGELPRATHALLKLAVEAQKNDMVSLGLWNRALLSGSKVKRER